MPVNRARWWQETRALLRDREREGHRDEALELLDAAAGELADETGPEPRAVLVGVLGLMAEMLDRGGQPHLAARTYDRAIEASVDVDGGAVAIAGQLLLRKARVLKRAGDREGALCALEEVRTIAGQTNGHREQWAAASFLRADILRSLDLSQDANAAYSQLVTSSSQVEQDAIEEYVVGAMTRLLDDLVRRGQRGEAMALADQILARTQQATGREIVEAALKVEIIKGRLLLDAGALVDASAVLAAVMHRGDDLHLSDYGEELILSAIQLQAKVFDARGQHRQADESFRAAVARGRRATNPDVLNQVALAMRQVAVRLDGSGARDEALAAYSELISKFADPPSPYIALLVGQMLTAKASLLQRMGDASRALEVLDATFDWYAALPLEPETVSGALEAQLAKCEVLISRGRLDEAIAICRALDEQHATDLAPQRRAQVARGLKLEAVALAQTDAVLAIEVLDELIARYANDKEVGVREQLAIAIINRGNRLGHLARFSEADDAYGKLVDNFDASESPTISEMIELAETRRTMLRDALE